MPTIVAWAYKYSIGQPFVYPQEQPRLRLELPQHVLLGAGGGLRGRPDPRAGRWTASSRCTPTTSRTPRPRRCASPPPRAPTPSPASRPGVACLWGPAHGGANEACLRMLREIGTVDRIPEFIARAKDKDDPFRLMGFGHRVYKNFDPRAKVMKQSADEVLGLLGIENNPTLQVAKELERIALEDPYFIEKKLYPNVDFYSGIILDAIGFPTSLFTPIFALARTVGWISQWKEMLQDPQLKIGRPRQLYTGADPARLRGCREPLSRRQRLGPARAGRGRAARPRRSRSVRLDEGTRTAEEAARACGCGVGADRQVDRVPRRGLRPPRAVPDRRRRPGRSGEGGGAGRRAAGEGRRRQHPRPHRLRHRRRLAARASHARSRPGSTPACSRTR